MLPIAASVVTPPLRPLPGSHGLPIIGPLKDRLDYFWFQGKDAFFRERMSKHSSTVFRTNLPPTFPFFLNVNPNVIALLDTRSFSTLFDLTLVNKSNILIGGYVPSLSFTGNTRVVVYQDPSEAGHAKGKGFYLELLKRGGRAWEDEVVKRVDEMMDRVASDVEKGGKAGLLIPMQNCVFAFLSKGIVGADLDDFPHLKDCGFAMLDKWLALQLLPITPVGIPQPLEEIFLHSFPFPSFLVSGDYNKLVDFVKNGGKESIELAMEYGLTMDEAIHNIIFVLGFNAFGGFSVFLPFVFKTIGKDKTDLQQRLREEVRRMLDGNKKLGFKTVNEMELLKSTIYEILRLNPPVPLQYARAKKDFVLTSHDSSFQVKKGELLCGYQPIAMRDPKAFDDPDSFVADRFMGEQGEVLLNKLFWSNGPQTDKPSVDNKQCAAKDHVVATTCMMIARIFSNYESFEIDDSLNIVKLEKALATVGAI